MECVMGHLCQLIYLHFPDHIEAGDHLAKHNMLVVQPLCAFRRQEELRAIAVGSWVGHREDSWTW